MGSIGVQEKSATHPLLEALDTFWSVCTLHSKLTSRGSNRNVLKKKSPHMENAYTSLQVEFTASFLCYGKKSFFSSLFDIFFDSYALFHVGENFHDHDTVGYEIEHGYSLVGKCSAREYMMYYVHCTVVIKCILKQVRFPTVPFNGMARLRWGRWKHTETFLDQGKTNTSRYESRNSTAQVLDFALCWK